MPEPLQTAYNKVNIVDADGNLISFSGGSGGAGPDSATATNQEEIITELQEIKDYGTPVTGAILPTGGSKLVGWLSAIWKAFTDRIPLPINGRIPIDIESPMSVSNSDLADINGKLPSISGGKIEAYSNLSPKYWREDFSGSALPTNWTLVQTGAGQSITIANSELQIVSGVTANSETIIEKSLDLRSDTRVTIGFLFRISSRVANQEIIFELNDGAGNSAQWIFSGTGGGNANISTSNGGFTTGNSAIGGLIDSSNYSIAQIEFKDSSIEFSNLIINNHQYTRQAVAVRSRQIPGADSLPSLKLRIRVRNLATAPISSTTTFIDAVSLSETQKILSDISGGFGGNTLHNSIPCNVLSMPSPTVYPLNSVNYSTESIFPLSASASFSGGSRDTRQNPRIVIYCLADQAGTLIFEVSPDSSTWLNCGSFPITAGQFFELSKVIALRYYRLRYTNGATAQTSFRLYSSQIAI